MSDPSEREALNADMRVLRDQAFVTLDERYGGAWLARPTPAGRDAWDEFMVRRADTAQRQRQLRNDYLRWLYARTRDGQFTVADHFLSAGQDFLGDPYSQSELSRAGAWLADRGFIAGPGADQRLRARPTVKGEDYVEAGRDVQDPTPENITSFTVMGDHNQIAHNSHHVTQVRANDALTSQAEQFAAVFEQIAPTLAPGDSEAVAQLADDLRSELEGGGRAARFREIGEAASKAFGAGVGGAVGTSLIASLSAWLGALG